MTSWRTTAWNTNSTLDDLFEGCKPNERRMYAGRMMTKEQAERRQFTNRRAKDETPQQAVRIKFSKIRSAAKRRGLEFNLDIDETVEHILETGHCELSGRPFVYKFGSMDMVSFDRIDNSKGYIPGNVQFVTNAVNIMRNELTTEQFIELCKDVARHDLADILEIPDLTYTQNEVIL